ncbi:MAG: L,D-transpeptidase family protein [Hyphomicrobiaceae bacterium]
MIENYNADLVVRSLNRNQTKGWLTIDHMRFPCALGRNGSGVSKREGDGITPIGRWACRSVFFRHDKRLPLPHPTVWHARSVRPSYGWCDAPGDRNYNRAVRHPYSASAESLWREDGLYDVVVILGYNDRPRIQGLGSAIFLHIARERPDGELQPTDGCVALNMRDLLLVIRHFRPGRYLRILA